jgi:uncharacterized Zn finger protein
MLPLASFITPEKLEELASRSHFRYGKQIAEEGEIEFTKTNTFNAVATVKHQNSQKRTVSLMSTTKGFRWKCTCTSKKGIFCQHCVAVGLAANQK